MNPLEKYQSYGLFFSLIWKQIGFAYLRYCKNVYLNFPEFLRYTFFLNIFYPTFEKIFRSLSSNKHTGGKSQIIDSPWVQCHYVSNIFQVKLRDAWTNGAKLSIERREGVTVNSKRNPIRQSIEQIEKENFCRHVDCKEYKEARLHSHQLVQVGLRFLSYAFPFQCQITQGDSRTEPFITRFGRWLSKKVLFSIAY